MKWTISLTNEIDRLAQGIGNNKPIHGKIEDTNTVYFIQKNQVPKESKIIYANFVVTYDLKK